MKIAQKEEPLKSDLRKTETTLLETKGEFLILSSVFYFYLRLKLK